MFFLSSIHLKYPENFLGNWQAQGEVKNAVTERWRELLTKDMTAN
jgi:hypothetical protein